ncbi:MAG: AbrB/MazE/SpoVT family DNA-binding domain-containing protein [Acidobacteriaceae bacterium]
MARSSTISSKGQITVPLEIRHRLGLREGDRVEFFVEDDLTILRPARPAENPFEKYVGALPAFSNKGEINRWVRNLRDEDVANT